MTRIWTVWDLSCIILDVFHKLPSVLMCFPCFQLFQSCNRRTPIACMVCFTLIMLMQHFPCTKKLLCGVKSTKRHAAPARFLEHLERGFGFHVLISFPAHRSKFIAGQPIIASCVGTNPKLGQIGTVSFWVNVSISTTSPGRLKSTPLTGKDELEGNPDHGGGGIEDGFSFHA